MLDLKLSFNPIDKVPLESGIMLSLKFVVSQQIGLDLDLILSFILKLI